MEKERRKYLLSKGDKKNHSHLIIIVDRSETIPEEIVKYVKREEDIKEAIFQLICNPNYEIWNIFNYDMNLEQQVNERKPYHIIATFDKREEAFQYAQKKHAGQTRKNGAPYINHPIKVVEIIEEYFQNHPRKNELIAAAYLHDTVEDTETTITEIKEQFGNEVAHLVNGVTNNKEQIKKMGKVVYLCNKVVNMDEEELNLKLCDRLANILDLNSASDDFREHYEMETTVVLNYLVTNRSLTDIQIKIVKEINMHINNLRKNNIKKLLKQVV